jgi:Amt family ammonium transporter
MEVLVMKRHPRVLLTALVLVILSGLPLFAQTTDAAQPKIDTGDTAWMLTSAALVLFMTIPGLFLFYGGLVRSKNVLGTLMQNFTMVGIVTIQWIVIGYSLAFATGTPFLGGLQWAGLNGVGAVPNPDYAATIPHQTFMFYQLMFAIITPL